MRPWSKKWFADCRSVCGEILQGKYAHWCPDLFNTPVDETRICFHFCDCFRCKCGAVTEPKFYPLGRRTMEMHDDIFICPERRFYNFWKHDIIDKTNELHPDKAERLL